MQIINDNSYFILYGWMSSLGLRAGELVIYAAIYGYTRNCGGFSGSLAYFSELTGLSRQTVNTAIRRLIDGGFIKKTPSCDKRFRNRYIYIALRGAPEEKDECQKTLHQMSDFYTSSVKKLDIINIDNKSKESIALNTSSSSQSSADGECPNETALNKYDEEFGEVWRLYPRKQGRDEARRAYAAARRSGVTRETVEEGLSGYIGEIRANGTPRRYVKQGGNWFKNRCWEDERSPAGPETRGQSPAVRPRLKALDYPQKRYTKEELIKMGVDFGDDVYE